MAHLFRSLAVLIAVAGPAVAQQRPTASPPSTAAIGVTPRVPTPSRPFPPRLPYAFQPRGSRPWQPNGGIGTTYFPPAAVYYTDSYQRAVATGHCLVDTAGNSVSATGFWSARPNSLPERRRLADWSRRAQGCYQAGLQAPLPLLRGALAEAELTQAPTPSASAPASSARLTAFSRAEAGRRRASDGDDRAMSAFASCVAPLAATQVTGLLATRHGSPDERRAMNRVLANGSSCIAGDWRLPDWGGTSFLRAYLAEAAYRWRRFEATAEVASAG